MYAEVKINSRLDLDWKITSVADAIKKGVAFKDFLNLLVQQTTETDGAPVDYCKLFTDRISDHYHHPPRPPDCYCKPKMLGISGYCEFRIN